MLVYDRTKTVVRRHVGRGQATALHREAVAFASHDGFAIWLAAPYRAETKGRVERHRRACHIPTSPWVVANMIVASIVLSPNSARKNATTAERALRSAPSLFNLERDGEPSGLVADAAGGLEHRSEVPARVDPTRMARSDLCRISDRKEP